MHIAIYVQVMLYSVPCFPLIRFCANSVINFFLIGDWSSYPWRICRSGRSFGEILHGVAENRKTRDFLVYLARRVKLVQLRFRIPFQSCMFSGHPVSSSHTINRDTQSPVHTRLICRWFSIIRIRFRFRFRFRFRSIRTQNN